MAARLLRRRSATAAWIYVAVACGILGTVVAARVLGLDEFGVFATALAAVGFFQVLLDLTVEESLTKYGFRYVAAEDWGRLRRLFRQMLLLKVLGGALATVILVGLAPFADEIFGADGLEQ
ncbi:MAG: oligosaccharide flippase family protein, partial [Thermoleophilia bacterium]|nr:oligosaccharide flippase family protein [Thermoleophilia bacterium]